MRKNFIYSLTNEEFKNIGLKVLTNGYGEDNGTFYVQLCDESGILDDKKYTCHYEILFMADDDIENGINHKKNNIYVEIHFESPKYSSKLCKTVKNLAQNNLELELFNWRNYCPVV